MAYLDSVLGRTAASRLRREKSSGDVQSLIEVIKNKNALAAQTAIPSGIQAAAARKMGTSVNAQGQLIRGKDESDTLMQRLARMAADAPGGITFGPTSRDYATQVRLWNNYQAGRGPKAAKPGTSKHGNGRANDIKYANDQVRQWVLDNADKYGLALPVYDPRLPRHLDESWHIEVKKGTY